MSSKFKDMLHNCRQGEDSEPEVKGSTRRQGKRKNPDYVQTTAYVRRTVHEETQINLIRDGKREFSELVEELLVAWNHQQANKD